MKVLIIFVILGICSCRSIQYVPVEKTKIEYRDRVDIQRDSIYRLDSVFVFQKGDTFTIYRDRYKYIYKNIYLRDTTFVQDSIQVPYPVEVIKNKVPGFMWWLILILSAISVPTILKIIRFFK